MKKLKEYVKRMFSVLLVISILLLSGCGNTESGSQRAVLEGQPAAADAQSQEQPAAADAQSQEQPAAADAQPQERNATGASTQMQGQDESRPQEQDIVSTKTQAEYEEEKRTERAMLEEKVKEADGISEEEAVEIARKAMEADLGRDAEGMELSIDETFGWSAELCIADWSEIKEKDRGTIAYWVNFNNGKKVEDFKDLVNYNCTVNAVDGSILEAYSSRDLEGTPVYYEH